MFKEKFVAAVITKNITAIDQLIGNGGNVNELIDKYGNTALILSARFNIIKVANFLIKNGADVNKQNIDGTTALSISSGRGYLEITELLVKNGADLNKADKNDITPLWIASYNRHFDVMKCLIKNGADLNVKNAAVIKLLIKDDADLTAANNKGVVAGDLLIGLILNSIKIKEEPYEDIGHNWYLVEDAYPLGESDSTYHSHDEV